jgi:hypothetical protein
MHKFWWLSLVVLSAQSAMAQDRPNPNLKGINAIHYQLFIEKTVGGNDCKINQGDLNNSIEFVANQSTTLKIVSNSQYVQHLSELERIPFNERYDEHNVLKEPERSYVLMPHFAILINPLQTTQFTCAGFVRADLSAHIEEKPHIIPTQVVVSAATVEIWSIEYGFVGSQQAFSNQAINLTEQIMKKLVNDWTASQ